MLHLLRQHLHPAKYMPPLQFTLSDYPCRAYRLKEMSSLPFHIAPLVWMHSTNSLQVPLTERLMTEPLLLPRHRNSPLSMATTTVRIVRRRKRCSCRYVSQRCSHDILSSRRRTSPSITFVSPVVEPTHQNGARCIPFISSILSHWSSFWSWF